MKFCALPKHLGYLFISLAFALAAGSAWGHPEQMRAQQPSAMRAKFPDAAKQPAFCTNCSRLSVHICSLPGYGCPSCNDFADWLGVVAFIDPDYYIFNHGNLASNPGTLTVQWYDLVAKSNRTRTIPVPAIPPGADDIVTFVTSGIVFLASEGVTLTLDYSDSAGTRHKVRKVTKCPDK